MKTSSLLILLLSFHLCMGNPDSVRIQPVHVDGKAMQVASYNTLNAKTDYYLLQENSNAPARAYLRTEDGFATTVFSSLELQTYLVSGDLSSLGRVVTIPGNNSPFQCVEKEGTNVLVYQTADRVYFIEYGGPISNLIGESTVNASGNASVNPPQSCEDRCRARLNSCTRLAKPEIFLICMGKFSDCLRTCAASSAISITNYSVAR